MVGIRPTYKTERNRAILLARREGRTYRSIGEEYGIKAETVRQICVKEERRERQAKGGHNEAEKL